MRGFPLALGVLAGALAGVVSVGRSHSPRQQRRVVPDPEPSIFASLSCSRAS